LLLFFHQGFRKISADRWEFANECFLRGNKQLLKSINRRRPHAGAQTSSSQEIVRPGLESELQNLRRDENALLQEVLTLQQDQMTTINQMSSLNQKLQTAEERQKQMVSFLARILRNPNMLAQFRIHQEQRHRRKFLKHQKPGQSSSLIQPPDTVWNDTTMQSVQGNELMRELSYLEEASIPEDVFPEVGLQEVDLHGSSSAIRPSTKGKDIMGEHQHSYSDKEQNIKLFPDIDPTGDPNLLELPDAFYDLDLDFNLEMAPVDKIVDGQVPPASGPY
jgi:hypothetical protein